MAGDLEFSGSVMQGSLQQQVSDKQAVGILLPYLQHVVLHVGGPASCLALLWCQYQHALCFVAPKEGSLELEAEFAAILCRGMRKRRK